MLLKSINLMHELVCGKNKLEVDAYGAKVLGLYLGGGNLLFYDEDDVSHSGIPLCFPGFGPLNDGCFQFAGKQYEMSQHGFIRNSIFNLIARGADFMSFELTSSPHTQSMFPFNFLFQVTYTLTEKELIIDFWIKNQSSEVMPLAPGIHPYFALKNSESVSFTSQAKFANDNLREYKVVEADEVLSRNDSELKITGAPDLHLIEHGLGDTTIIREGEENIVMTADNSVFNRMVIWRKESRSPYICIEPAYEQNGLNDNPLKILPGKAFETRVKIALA